MNLNFVQIQAAELKCCNAIKWLLRNYAETCMGTTNPENNKGWRIDVYTSSFFFFFYV